MLNMLGCHDLEWISIVKSYQITHIVCHVFWFTEKDTDVSWWLQKQNTINHSKSELFYFFSRLILIIVIVLKNFQDNETEDHNMASRQLQNGFDKEGRPQTPHFNRSNHTYPSTVSSLTDINSHKTLFCSFSFPPQAPVISVIEMRKIWRVAGALLPYSSEWRAVNKLERQGIGTILMKMQMLWATKNPMTYMNADLGKLVLKVSNVTLHDQWQ